MYYLYSNSDLFLTAITITIVSRVIINKDNYLNFRYCYCLYHYYLNYTYFNLKEKRINYYYYSNCHFYFKGHYFALHSLKGVCFNHIKIINLVNYYYYFDFHLNYMYFKCYFNSNFISLVIIIVMLAIIKVTLNSSAQNLIIFIGATINSLDLSSNYND